MSGDLDSEFTAFNDKVSVVIDDRHCCPRLCRCAKPESVFVSEHAVSSSCHKIRHKVHWQVLPQLAVHSQADLPLYPKTPHAEPQARDGGYHGET